MLRQCLKKYFRILLHELWIFVLVPAQSYICDCDQWMG